MARKVALACTEQGLKKVSTLRIRYVLCYSSTILNEP